MSRDSMLVSKAFECYIFVCVYVHEHVCMHVCVRMCVHASHQRSVSGDIPEETSTFFPEIKSLSGI